MAKANDKSSTIDWIWLRDALKLAISRFGSVALAKALLREWLATGKLPWSCMAFKTLDAEDIAALENAQSDGIIPFRYIPSSLREGEPEFWRADLTIDWEDNIAHENTDVGPTALGIKVSGEHLLALLPDEPRDHVEQPEQTRTAEPELLPKAWLAAVRKEHPQQRNEQLVTYAGRLHGLMQKAHVTKLWTPTTLLRRLHDK
jgi:hypothetical protein